MMFMNDDATRKMLPIHCTFALLLLSASSPAIAEQTLMRYRGDYTYSHEVNSFCPEINSQCYWLSDDTSVDIRRTLRALSSKHTSMPFESTCVVIEATIDRKSQLDGLAADFDGLVTVSRLFGVCTETTVITQADLQHHRWLLSSINGRALDGDQPENVVPELDFGERMHVAGNSGCNHFTGTGVLHNQFFAIERMASTRKRCTTVQNSLEQTVLKVLAGRSEISIEDSGALVLESGDTVLRFELRDWVR